MGAPRPGVARSRPASLRHPDPSPQGVGAFSFALGSGRTPLRNLPDDPADVLVDDAAPERRCILTGEHGTRDGLIRLALGPDGSVAPDLGSRAGGRGAWLGVARPALETALARGKLKGALARAFKTADFTIPADLAERIEAGLAARAMDRVGLENRAGTIISGSERIEAAIVSGVVGALVSADDAGVDGLTSLRAKLRTANPAAAAITAPVAREALSRALGRANTVHLAVRSGGPSARVVADIVRWRVFLGCSSHGAGQSRADAPHVANSGDRRQER